VVNDHEEERIRRGSSLVKPCIEVVEVDERTIRQVPEQQLSRAIVVRRRIERLRVSVGVERLQPHRRADMRLARGHARRLPVKAHPLDDVE
jgi:hypothetical protein